MAVVALHRPAFPIPSTTTTRSSSISFYHPAYDPPLNLLFSLPRVDPTGNGPTALGVHHRTALLACQIVANNAFDAGRLAFDADGQHLVEARVPLDGILTDCKYYFIVNSDAKYRYPVVPSFRDWQFPHRRIPDFWSSPTSGAQPSTPRCAVTNNSFGLTRAHLIPGEESDWFRHNGMSCYGTDTWDTSDCRNFFRLRGDIHTCFDKRIFAIVPKPESASTMTTPPEPPPAHPPQYVVHVLGVDAVEFSELYHNRVVQYLGSTSREYLFARFAWSVFLNVKPFILAGIERLVARYQMLGGIKMEMKIEDISGPTLLNQYGGGGSRSASPRKRKPQNNNDEDRDLDENDQWYAENMAALEDWNRGRKRTRTGDNGWGGVGGICARDVAKPTGNWSESAF